MRWKMDTINSKLDMAEDQQTWIYSKRRYPKETQRKDLKNKISEQ